MILRRLGSEPLLTRQDIPDMPPDIVDPSSVFNPGAVRRDGRTVLLLRVQTRGRRTFTVPAAGSDGIRFKVADRPVVFDWNGRKPENLHHIYDARVTLLEGVCRVVTAVDLGDGCRLAVWEASGNTSGENGSCLCLGLEKLRFLGWVGDGDTRNGVLFPERIGGRFLLLERPNHSRSGNGPASGDEIILSVSTDLRNWTEAGQVMSGRPHYWDELIGPGPPPVKTRHGWLLVYHGVATHFRSVNIYQAGAALLDLEDPTRVLARTGDNILEPRETWELTGQVPNVVFPGGLTVDHLDDEGFAPDEAEVRIYYGAADTAVGLAQTTIGELVAACRPASGKGGR